MLGECSPLTLKTSFVYFENYQVHCSCYKSLKVQYFSTSRFFFSAVKSYFSYFPIPICFLFSVKLVLVLNIHGVFDLLREEINQQFIKNTIAKTTSHFNSTNALLYLVTISNPGSLSNIMLITRKYQIQCARHMCML